MSSILHPCPKLNTHEVDINSLSKDLLRDFYQTFRLSQGETAIQSALFHFLAQEHQEAGHQSTAMQEALSQAGHEVERLMPPAHHIETTAEERREKETGFQAMWDEYVIALSNDPEPYRSLELILDDILARDIKYQEQERPNRTEKQDVHESIAREYILGDKLTGSEQLLAVRDKMRSTLLTPPDNSDSEWMRNRLGELTEEWESNHPGNSFVPAVR